ncbi:hypothetical protein FKM82_030915 [Ascaphus truei]
MTEETDTEEHLTPIKREIDSFPVEGFPVIVTESLEIKSEKEEPDTEDLLTQINRVVVTFPVDGEYLKILLCRQRLSFYKEYGHQRQG